MYDISLPVMQTMQMRAQRPATAGAARGQARLQIGEGPGCVSGLSVQPGIMLLVPLVPFGRLPPHISYMTKRARPVSGVVEGGNVRLCSLSGRKIVESAERGRCVRPLRGMGEGRGCAELFLGRSSRGFHHRRPVRGKNLGCDGMSLMLSLWPHAESNECGCLA